MTKEYATEGEGPFTKKNVLEAPLGKNKGTRSHADYQMGTSTSSNQFLCGNSEGGQAKLFKGAGGKKKDIQRFRDQGIFSEENILG